MEQNVGFRLVTAPRCLSEGSESLTAQEEPPVSAPAGSLHLIPCLCPVGSCSWSAHLMLSPGRRSRESVQSQSSWTRIPMEHVSPAPAPSAQGAPSQLLLGFAGVQSMVLSPTTPPVSGWQPLRHSDFCPPPLSLLGDCHRESIQKCPVSGLKFLLDISHLD